MESLYHQTNRNLQEAHRCFAKLERSLHSEDGREIEREILARIEHILSDMERLDVLVHKEHPTRRHNAKIRVDQLKSDVQHLQSSIRSIQAKRRSYEQQEESRDELLRMRFTTNAAAAQSETSILIDKALEHNDSLIRSNRGLDDLLGQGHSMLETLRDQRNLIKGFQTKLLNVASVLGMSNTVLRLIERRSQGDKYIFFGGMLFTLVFILIVILYFK